MQNCRRYYDLREHWVHAGVTARQNGIEPERTPEWNEALNRLRAHAEICEQCIAALFSAFPETEGKTIFILSVMENS
jgi:hypothetical protein